MDMRPLPLDPATYRERRATAARICAEHHGRVPLLVLGVDDATLQSGLTPIASRPRQDAWFDWFTGCREPDAALLVEPGTHAHDTLFLPRRDPRREAWEGPRAVPGPDAQRHFAVDATAASDELKRRVRDAADRCGGQIAVIAKGQGFQSRAASLWRSRLRGIRVIDVGAQLIPCRMVKTPAEIALHRRAVRITAAGLKAVLPRIPHLRREAEIASALVAHYLAPASDPLAFPPIVAAGANAATLHYPHNDQPLVKRGCILLDTGASWQGYCADVTRTVPQHGRFDDARLREVYELVLRCNRLGTRHARPGITLQELDEIAWRPIVDAGFARLHRLSHHIGLDVHDAADRTVPLEAGMLISNEPGIYLRDEGIGVRIEDDLLITGNGCEVTTRAIPKSVAGIERLMRPA